MDTKKITKWNKETRNVSINIRVKSSLSKWLKEKNYSPTALFQEACKDLGYKDPQGKTE